MATGSKAPQPGLNAEAESKLAKDGWGDEAPAAPATNGKTKAETLDQKFSRLVEKLKIHGIHFS